MELYITVGFFLAFIGGTILFFSIALSEDTAMAMIAGSLFGLILLILRTLTGVSTVNIWINVVYGLIAYFFAYFLIFKDFQKVHPNFKSSFFQFLHLRASTAKITYSEMSSDKTVEDMLEISGLISGEKTEAQKLLDEPISGAFWGWSTWIINLVLFTVITAGAAGNNTIGEYFSKFFSALFGEECLVVVGALIIIAIIVFVKNKLKKPEPLIIKIDVRPQMRKELFKNMATILIEKGYTREKAIAFAENTFDNGISQVFWAKISSCFSDVDIINWKEYLKHNPSEIEQWNTLEKFYAKKAKSNFNQLIRQITEYYIKNFSPKKSIQPHSVIAYLNKTAK